jgi:hypothetical protein
LIAVAPELSRRRDGYRTSRIQQADAAGDDDQHLLALEARQRPAHGFDRQSQIIRDILGQD